MATTTYVSFSNTTRTDTDNSAYNDILIDTNTDYNSWWLTTDTDTDQEFTATLDGVDYDLRLRWNTRDESWQVIIGLSGEDPSVTFKATNGLDLLKPYKYLEGVPDGALYIIDTVAINGRPSFGDTGISQRFRLAYKDALEDQA